MNRFYPIKALIFFWEFFVFLLSIIQYFQFMWDFIIQISEKSDIYVVDDNLTT